ncbi:MAG: transposase [Verrucomicrobia bacterium]|nr:transposase [Verrucomicrobiota bacterium]
MRHPRLKGSDHPSFYHCVSRVTAGQFIFQTTGPGSLEAEHFVTLMHRLADFCGIAILTYALMSNHFHLLCEVPPPRELSDTELLARIETLYGRARREAVQRVLEGGSPGGTLVAQAVRQAYRARMFDLSGFLKELKGCFAQWYNRRHGRFGALWAERFKSVLVEGGPALAAVALYIDLNPVRAGLCADPKDYRYCGYGEAVGAGRSTLRAGLARALGFVPEQVTWAEVGPAYRQCLFRAGTVAARPRQVAISPEQAEHVIEEQEGEICLAELLRCRLRFFSCGVVLGSQRFVEAQLGRWGCRPRGQPAAAPAASAVAEAVRSEGAMPGRAPDGGWAEWFVCWRGQAVPVRAPG